MTRVSARTRANRANAQKSTGPKTPEGKARSSRNAIRHGCLAMCHDGVETDPGRRQDTPGVAPAPTRPQLLHWIRQINARLVKALEETPDADVARRADIFRMLRLMHRYDRRLRNRAGHR